MAGGGTGKPRGAAETGPGTPASGAREAWGDLGGGGGGGGFRGGGIGPPDAPARGGGGGTERAFGVEGNARDAGFGGDGGRGACDAFTGGGPGVSGARDARAALLGGGGGSLPAWGGRGGFGTAFAAPPSLRLVESSDMPFLWEERTLTRVFGVASQALFFTGREKTGGSP